jgi:hypothetical protein
MLKGNLNIHNSCFITDVFFIRENVNTSPHPRVLTKPEMNLLNRINLQHQYNVDHSICTGAKLLEFRLERIWILKAVEFANLLHSKNLPKCCRRILTVECFALVETIHRRISFSGVLSSSLEVVRPGKISSGIQSVCASIMEMVKQICDIEVG